MSNWNLSPSGHTESLGFAALGSESKPPTMTSGSANSKGSWVELTASTKHDIAGFWAVHGIRNSADSGRNLIDIAVGASGSEQVIVSNFLRDQSVDGYRLAAYSWFPLAIKKGSRVSARFQAHLSSINLAIQLQGLYCGNWADDSLQRADTYGITTASSAGKTIGPVVTVDTKTAWVEITPATERDHEALMVCLANGPDLTRGAGYFHIDVGIGAAGSEVVVLGDMPAHTQAFSHSFNPKSLGAFAMHIKKGTRIAVRAQCHVLTSTEFDVSVIGFS